MGDLRITKTFKYLTQQLQTDRDLEELFADNFDGLSQPWLVILRAVQSKKTVEIQITQTTTLGRSVTAAHAHTHIDLTPYGAQQFGVSRMHAALKVYNQQLVIVDLNSTNGTFLNGSRLPVQAIIPVKEGAILELGKLRLQLVLSAAVKGKPATA